MLLVAACASGHKSTDGGREVTASNSAIVVRGSELSGGVIQGLRHRVPSMQVTIQTGECPRILFRGTRSIRNQMPTVYVDGTRMTDTCILSQLSAGDIDFVEVYPSGNTQRSSYERNPFGLILVFLRKE